MWGIVDIIYFGFVINVILSKWVNFVFFIFCIDVFWFFIVSDMLYELFVLVVGFKVLISFVNVLCFFLIELW